MANSGSSESFGNLNQEIAKLTSHSFCVAVKWQCNGLGGDGAVPCRDDIEGGQLKKPLVIQKTLEVQETRNA